MSELQLKEVADAAVAAAPSGGGKEGMGEGMKRPTAKQIEAAIELLDNAPLPEKLGYWWYDGHKWHHATIRTTKKRVKA